MSSIYFLIRYTPFWAIPTILIGLEFSYVYWLRSRKKEVAGLMVATFISLSMIIFYYWAGGPEKSVQFVIRHFGN